MQSDAELVGTVLAGDREAFAALVHRYRQPACAAAAQVLKDRHAAQDAAQEAFVTAYRKLGTLRRASAFGPWVVKMARRQAIDMARQRRATVPLESQDDPPDERNDGRLDETSQRLLSAVMSLPRQERVAVMLRYFDGCTSGAIAEITGRSEGTVRKQLSRARERLRKRLKEMRP